MLLSRLRSNAPSRAAADDAAAPVARALPGAAARRPARALLACAALCAACALAQVAAPSQPAWAMPTDTPGEALESPPPIEDTDTAVRPGDDENAGQDTTDETSGSDAADDTWGGWDSSWENPPADSDQGPSQEEINSIIDEYLAANLEATGVPGVAVAVVSSQGTLYEGTVGDCTSVDSAFTIGSLSKSFTALAIMQLVEQGKVDLDQPATTYVPEYDFPREVTVRSLLNQTSGFGYYESLREAQVSDTLGIFSYANANYDLLGRIVESVSGQSYGDYLRDHVFGPLGMDDASAGDAANASGTENQVGHRNYFGTAVADGYVHPSGDGAWGGPASGYVHASLSDMEAYLRMYLNKGVSDDGEQVISEDSLDEMVYDRVPDPNGDTYYGMGWTTYYWDNDELVMSHAGEVENFVASMVVIPDRDLAIVVLGDASDNYGGDDEFFSLADGVVSAAIGSIPDDVDGDWPATLHGQANATYAELVRRCAPAVAVGLVAAPLIGWALRRRWATRTLSTVAVAAVALFASDAALVWKQATVDVGMAWREIIAFVPDAALTYGGCALALVACAVLMGAIVVVRGVPRQTRESHAVQRPTSPLRTDALE